MFLVRNVLFILAFVLPTLGQDFPVQISHGIVGKPFGTNILVPMGQSFRLEVTHGMLPSGLKLSQHGKIIGTPKVAGNQLFIITTTIYENGRWLSSQSLVEIRVESRPPKTTQ